jgi:hypothetical protein
MATYPDLELVRRVSALEARVAALERERGTSLAASYARGPSRETIALHVELAKLPFRLAFAILAALSIVAAVGSTIYRFWFD